MATLTVGALVVRRDDEKPWPLIGEVLGHEDEDRVLVAWGDAAWAEDPHAQARVEDVDDLAPYERRPCRCMDTASSASRQHFIDTGSYLRVGEAL